MLIARQTEVLRSLAAHRGRVPRADVDGRVLRPLKSRGFVTEHEGTVALTVAAEAYLARKPSSARPPRKAPPPRGRLSDPQEEVLRYVCRQRAPVLADHLDGRVLRALRARGFVSVRRERVEATPEGRAYVEVPARQEPKRRGRRGSSPAAAARAAAVRRALGELERVLPRDAEVLVGNILAHVDDVVQGFRKLARRTEQGPARKADIR